MISLRGVTFRYPDAAALDRIDFTWHPGERIAMMGPNGSGKTTLALLIKGLLNPTEGRIEIDGIAAAAASTSKVGIVFQNPEDQLAAATLEREAAFGLENRGLPRQEMAERVESILRQFGLWEYRRHPPHLLSGGQMQKLALASTLVTQPDYLIFDESTSMLDPASRKDFLSSLKNLPLQTGVLFITQIAREALDFPRLIVLVKGGIFYDGEPAGFFPRRELTETAGVEPPVRFKLKRQ